MRLQLALASAGLLLALAQVASAGEMACGSTGGMNRCPLPGADKLHVKVKQVLEGQCTFDKSWWADSDGIVVDKGCNAVFDYKSSAGDQQTNNPNSNEQAYYNDGCKAGKEDAKAGMSMAHERHSDQYDSRFEPYFAKGYDKCWAANR